MRFPDGEHTVFALAYGIDNTFAEMKELFADDTQVPSFPIPPSAIY
jgi:hypothetical protein